MYSRLLLLIAIYASISSCSGFHDRSNLESLYEPMNAQEDMGAIEGDVSWLINDYQLPDVVGQEVILLNNGLKVASTVTFPDGRFKFQSIAPSNNYVLRFPVSCWETSWHIRYAKRKVDFPISVRAGNVTKIKVAIDCPQQPISVS